jgi:hypothetical protein
MVVVVCCGEKLREFALALKKVVLTKITPCIIVSFERLAWILGEVWSFAKKACERRPSERVERRGYRKMP